MKTSESTFATPLEFQNDAPVGNHCSNELYRIHAALCHQGVSRLHHFVTVKNLWYSLDDVKRITANCAIYCEVKPRFANNTGSAMIKLTQSHERLSVDFKNISPLRHVIIIF